MPTVLGNNSWPSFMYRLQKKEPGYEARVFQNQEELDAAGDGWEDNPEKLEGIGPKYPYPGTPKVVKTAVEEEPPELEMLTEKQVKLLKKADLFDYARAKYGLGFPTPAETAYDETTKKTALKAVLEAMK